MSKTESLINKEQIDQNQEEVKNTNQHRNKNLFQKDLMKDAIINSIKKLNPVSLWRTPVIFCVEISALLTTLLCFQNFSNNNSETLGFTLQISIWLWFTVIFANFAEAIAESRGKAQAESLRKTKKDLMAKKIPSIDNRNFEVAEASKLRTS